MSRQRFPATARSIFTGLAAACAGVAVAALGLATPAQAAGQTLYVSTSGNDSGSRSSAGEHPLATIGRAIRLAQPGDRIVVRGGTYTEAAGYGATPGRPEAPIRLLAATGQRVVLKGTLQLDGADYWQVKGINVTVDPGRRRTEYLVKFDGGTGWRFTDAEVWGSRGVSNIMISASSRNGTPSGYRITGNCIHDNNATGDAFMNDHNIYLMPGYNAGRGVISRNIFYNSENGAAIKAAGPSSATGASNVVIENNTIVRSAAGVIIGYGSNRVTVQRNLIGDQVRKIPRGAQWVANYRAAVVGNHVSGAGNRLSRNGIWDYPVMVYTTQDSTRALAQSAQARVRPAFNQVSSCAGFRPRDQDARSYGRYAS